MFKVGIFSIGQCGGNIAYSTVNVDRELQEKAGDNYVPFIVEALNSTEFDAKDLKELGVPVKIIGDKNADETEGGSAKQRKTSKNTFKKYGREAINDMTTEFANCQIIIGQASTGGGTGSGQVVMVMDILKSSIAKFDKEKGTKKKRAFIIYGVAPSLSEDIKALSNSVECIKEMNNLPLAYILLDNERVGTNAIKEIFDKVNSAAVDDMRVLRGDFNSIPGVRNIDFGDWMSLLTTPGLMSINKITGIKETDLDKNSIDSLIIKSIKESYNIQMEKDKIVGKIGIILSLTESMFAKFDESLTELQNEIGKTPYKFIHVNLVESEEETSIITILAGLSCPDSRLSEYVDTINAAKEELTKVKETKVEDLNESVSWFNDDEDESDDEPEEDIDDIMGKY